MTEIILLAGRKGGITKSTLAANISAGLAIAGYRVAAIESDGQGSLSRMMRVRPDDGLYKLLAESAEWDDVLQPVPGEFAGEGLQLWLLPSDSRQMEIEHVDWVSDAIYQRFEELHDSFDFVVIDTSPAIHEINSAFYYVADWMILPTLCERPSIDMLHINTLSYIGNAQAAARKAGIPAAQILGIVPNRFDARKTTARMNVGFIDGRYGEKFHVFPPMRELAAWSQAAQLRQSIFNYADSPDATNHERRQSQEAVREISPIIRRVLEVAGVAV